MVRCHVKGCGRSAKEDKNHHFFRQPKNSELRQKWREFAQVPGSPTHLRICSDHFEPRCIRKKFPRPLLLPESVPTISPGQSAQDNINGVNREPTAKFEISALQDECSHKNKSIVMDITKATGEDPTVIEIQTNNKIRIVVTDDETDTATQNQSSLSHAASTTNNCSCIPTSIQLIDNVASPITKMDADTVDQNPSSSADLCKSPSHEIISTPTKKSTCRTPKSVRLNISTPPNRVTPRGGKFKKHILLTPKSLRISTQRRTISLLRSKIQKLQKQRNKSDITQRSSEIESIISQCAKYLSTEAHTFFASHLRLCNVKLSRRRYNDKLKDIALSIKYHSPQAYRFLRKIINLPSERTLSEYQRKFPIYPGLNFTILNQLNSNFQDVAAKDRAVSILFDEIHLTPEIHYNSHSDSFKGIIDDGITREPKEARTALVAMITWINKPMKQAVGYWLLGKSGNSAKTHKIMLTTVENIFSVGLVVKCLISDQGPRNVGLLKKVGVTSKKPFFKLPGINHKIFVMFDPPHLLKSIRNNLKDKRLYYRGGFVDWNEIHTVYKLSQLKPLNLIPKIGEHHFNLSTFTKMNVSLAAQIFSESMYTAHLVYRTMFPEKFKGKDDRTGEFISDVDKLFDTLNSRLERKSLPNKLNYAMTKDSEHYKFLTNMLQYLDQCKFERGNEPPCIKGLIITINSVIQLSNDLQENYDIHVLKTRRLNQDPLENLFATIRQQNGCSLYPSPIQFETGMRQIFITHLTKISNATNCETDDNVIFAKLSNIETSSVKPIRSPTQIPTQGNSTITLLSTNITDTLESEINTEVADFTETNAVYYICGYLAAKFLKNHKCEECQAYMILPDSSVSYNDYKLFTIMKNYANTNGLKYSTETLFNIVLKWDQKFRNIIKSLLHFKGISNELNKVLRQECPSFKLCSPEATNVFINTYIRIRCYWEARFMRRALAKTALHSNNVVSVENSNITKNNKEKKKMTKFM